MRRDSIFKKKVSIGLIDNKEVCLLYIVDRVSKRPVKVDIYDISYYQTLKLVDGELYLENRY